MISFEENEPIIEVKPLSRRSSGQWYLKENGRFYYFGSDQDAAEKRALIWRLTGIYARKHSLLDFAKQYLAKTGFQTHDETYVAIWTLRSFNKKSKVEDVHLWFDAQEAFFEYCEPDSRVYIVKDMEGDVKIGYAKNVHSRLASLQTGSKTKLSLITSLPGGRNHEQQLHHRFRDYRMEGEWFRRQGSLDEFVTMTTNILQC